MMDLTLLARQPLRCAPIRPAPIRRTAIYARLRLVGAAPIEQAAHGVRPGRGIPAPPPRRPSSADLPPQSTNWEGRVVMLAGFQRQIEQRFALRGAGFGVGEDHGVPEDNGAVLGPEIEMADPELGVHIHQQVGNVLAAHAFGDAHVEGRRQVQRLEVFAPGEAEMMVAPLAGDRRDSARPAPTARRPSHWLPPSAPKVERMQNALGFIDMGKLMRPDFLDPRHKTKQLRTKLAQDFDKTRVRDSSSPARGKIPQVRVTAHSTLRRIDSPTTIRLELGMNRFAGFKAVARLTARSARLPDAPAPRSGRPSASFSSRALAAIALHRFELLAGDEIHVGHQPLQPLADKGVDLGAHALGRPCRPRR